MTQRLDYMKQSPELFRKFLDFSLATDKSSIDRTIRDLVHIRASQINGCAFCIDMHHKEATIHGERPLRLYNLAAWRESPLFDARECAALAWTEALTTIPPHGVPQTLFDEVRKEFTEQELADLTFIIMAINGWNRLSIGFASVPGSMDKAYGLDKAGLA